MKTILIPIPADVWGGLQAVIASIDPYLKKHGFHQIVLLPIEAESVQRELHLRGVTAYCVELPRFQRNFWETIKTLLLLPKAIFRLLKIDEVKNCSIVQAVGAHHPYGPILSLFLKKPLVWQFHSDSLKGFPLFIIKQYLKFHQNGVVANGHPIGNYFCGTKFLSGNHEIFYPPLDFDKFKPDILIRSSVRSNLNLNDTDILLGTVGNMGWQKNHQLIIEIAEASRQINCNFKFLIIGGTVSSYEKTYNDEVKLRAEKLNSNHPNTVNFLENRTDIAQLVQSFDIFMMTSHSEGIPIAIAEAMCAAKPIISSNVGSISDVVIDGQNGYLIDEIKANNFLNKMVQLTSSNDQYLNFCRNSEKLARQLFCPKSVAEKHAKIYLKSLL
jgi:glycosyltransferase involved in cell wall biosynthesis